MIRIMGFDGPGMPYVIVDIYTASELKLIGTRF